MRFLSRIADLEVLDYPHDVILSKNIQRRRYNLLISKGKIVTTEWTPVGNVGIFAQLLKKLLKTFYLVMTWL